MKLFLKIGDYLFCPLLTPLFGTLIYFLASPRFIPSSIVEAKLFAILILTVFIPLLFLFLLKNVKIITSIKVITAKERRLPLLGAALLLLTITNFIVENNLAELYYFFTALLLSVILTLTLSLFRYKISLHMLGIAALLGFVMGLSWLYKINLLLLISGLVFAVGWTASSRIQAQQPSHVSLVLGLLIGFLPQVLFFVAALIHYSI